MRRFLRAFCAALLLTAAAPGLAHAQHDLGSPSEAAPFGTPVDDEHVWTHAILDQLEGRFGNNSVLHWDGEAWSGTDTHRLWLKSEGEAQDGKVSSGRHEALYDTPVSTYFDLQAGLRGDLDSRTGRVWAAFGIEGLAEYFFHVSATAYASGSGHYAARFMAAYELLLTQRLILQPRIEINIYAKDDPARAIGAGLSSLETGLRLRYEISRKFAPYIGLAYEQSFSGTADFLRAAGERSHSLRLVTGVRGWF